MKPNLEIKSVWEANLVEGVDPNVFYEMLRPYYSELGSYEAFVAEMNQKMIAFEAKVQYPYQIDDRTIITGPGQVVRK